MLNGCFLYLLYLGSIGAAVGAVIVSGLNTTTTPISSPLMHMNNQRANNTQTATFANILPELYQTSPRKQFEDSGAYSLQQSIMTAKQQQQQDEAIEVSAKLREKNNTLEQKILELETRLRDTETQKKNFEIAFNSSDRKLAEAERTLTSMNTEKVKAELANKNEMNDIRLLRKEITDLKEDKHTLETRLALLQATNNAGQTWVMPNRFYSNLANAFALLY